MVSYFKIHNLINTFKMCELGVINICNEGAIYILARCIGGSHPYYGVLAGPRDDGADPFLDWCTGSVMRPGVGDAILNVLVNLFGMTCYVML